MTKEEKAVLREAAAILQEHREDIAADGLVVTVGSVAPTLDTAQNSVVVGITFDGEMYTGSAKYFEDACAIARCNRAAELKRREEEAKRRQEAKARVKTSRDRAHEQVLGL